MMGEELIEHRRHLVEKGIIRRCRRPCVNHDNHVIRLHLFSQHECVFPTLHFAISGAQIFAFAATECLQGLSCIFICEEDHFGTYLATESPNQSKTGNEVVLFLGVTRYSNKDT